MPKLSVSTKILAFSDSNDTNNPRKRNVDWYVNTGTVECTDPSGPSYVLAAGESKVIFDGSRTTSEDGTTTFALTLSPLSSSTYRFTHSSGTNPVLRTGRSLTPNTMDLTWTVNANATVTLTSDSPLFGSVVAGDFLFAPNTSTGDTANVISEANSGYWQVLSKASTTEITLVRPAGEDFQGETETVTMTANTQLRAFSSAGVQVGDYVDISAAFSSAVLKTYEVTAVNDLFFEVVSTLPLPEESAAPGAAGLAFYTNNKNFLYVESDQECVVQVNGDTSESNRIVPMDPSDSAKPAMYLRTGPSWALTVVNRSAYEATVVVISAV